MFLHSENFEGNETQSFNTSFTVATDAQVGEVSTIVVTATSTWDGAQNSAVAYLIVTSCVSNDFMIILCDSTLYQITFHRLMMRYLQDML